MVSFVWIFSFPSTIKRKEERNYDVICKIVIKKMAFSIENNCLCIYINNSQNSNHFAAHFLLNPQKRC